MSTWRMGTVHLLSDDNRTDAAVRIRGALTPLEICPDSVRLALINGDATTLGERVFRVVQLRRACSPGVICDLK